MGIQEIAMIVGGILLLSGVVWVVNKVSKGSASQKQ